MKVLVIEDDPSLREIICRSLEKERYVTEEAPDFQTALEKTADYTYDCILLDIMLPDGNGLDLLEELKKENKKENIIIISAKDSLEDKVTGLDLGADDYLKVLSVEIIMPVPLISNTVISGSTRNISRYLLQVPPSN